MSASATQGGHNYHLRSMPPSSPVVPAAACLQFRPIRIFPSVNHRQRCAQSGYKGTYTPKLPRLDVTTDAECVSKCQYVSENVQQCSLLHGYDRHNDIFGSRPSDHYFRSVCLFVCLFVCAEFFSAVFDPISIKLGHGICLGLVVFPRI